MLNLRNPSVSLAALLLCGLLCGCARASESASPVEFSEPVLTAPAASDSTAPTEPVTAAVTTDAVAAVAQLPPARTFTDGDFHFYVAGTGSNESGKINITFYPDNRNSAGEPDPNIRVWDSWEIQNETEIRDICSRILASEYYSESLYGRTLDSMVTEWQAHNDINAVYDNERTRHVDFNRADEGLAYLDFWKRAVDEFTESRSG